MVEAYRKKSWWSVVLAGTVMLAVLGYFYLPMLARKLDNRANESKMYYETTATVKGKVYVRFDDHEAEHTYKHENGYTVRRRPGSEEWRISYQVENFDQLSASDRSRYASQEVQRASVGELRYWLADKERYDRVKVGDKLIVGYKPLGDGKLDVANVSKANE